MDNLPLYSQISFDTFLQHGHENGANIVNGMPWSWKINNKTVTHENRHCYIVKTIKGFKKFELGDQLIATKDGLDIIPYTCYETHCPGGCPL